MTGRGAALSPSGDADEPRARESSRESRPYTTQTFAPASAAARGVSLTRERARKRPAQPAQRRASARWTALQARRRRPAAAPRRQGGGGARGAATPCCALLLRLRLRLRGCAGGGCCCCCAACWQGRATAGYSTGGREGARVRLLPPLLLLLLLLLLGPRAAAAAHFAQGWPAARVLSRAAGCSGRSGGAAGRQALAAGAPPRGRAARRRGARRRGPRGGSSGGSRGGSRGEPAVRGRAACRPVRTPRP
jgi:hypothetical protein